MPKRVERHKKVASAIKKELGQIIQSGEVKDDRMAPFVSIIDVELSPNLAHARIDYSILNSAEDPSMQAGTQAALESHAGRLSGLIARRLNLRYAPNFSFEFNDALTKGSDLIDLINRVTDEEARNHEKNGL